MPSWTAAPDWFDLENQVHSYFPAPGFGAFSRPVGFHPHGSCDYRDTDPLHRLRCVKDAFFYANTPTMLRLGRRFAEIDVREVARDLIDSAADMARILIGGMLMGGLAGGALGGLGGGVGAVPGLAAGTAVGLKAGSWIVASLGLSALADFVVDGMPAIFAGYHRGVSTAWNAPPDSDQPFSHSTAQEYLTLQRAGEQIADAHEAMVILLLSAIAAYLSRNGVSSAGLLQQMGNTQRGQRLAQWVAKHEQAIRQHPLLQTPRPAMAMAMASGPMGQEFARPSASSPGTGTGTGTGTRGRRARRMPRVHVPCFSAERMPHSKIDEFDRQLVGQQEGMNALTIHDYETGRAAFAAGSVKRDPRQALIARQKYTSDMNKRFTRELSVAGNSGSEVARLATMKTQEVMGALAALHNPDLIAGGKDVISDFGDRQVNSSIGPQWRSRAQYLDQAVRSFLKSVRSSDLAEVRKGRMVTVLTRCGLKNNDR